MMKHENLELCFPIGEGFTLQARNRIDIVEPDASFTVVYGTCIVHFLHFGK